MNREVLSYLRQRYIKGTVVELLNMCGVSEMPQGIRGTVYYVDDAGHICVNWDNGRSLSLLPEVDSFRVISRPR